jgi:protein SCO1/2
MAVAAAILLLSSACGGGTAKLVGTDLGKTASPDFTLTDQRGETVRLEDLRGKAVALTFIYTHCPDVCPLTAQNFRAAYDLLGQKAQGKVALLAVTVDPARDTTQALQAFSAAHGLADNPTWHALRGDPATLQAVWDAYGIDPGAMMDEDQHGGATPVGGGSGHTDAIYLIDPQGRQRVLMHSDLKVRDLAANLKALAG